MRARRTAKAVNQVSEPAGAPRLRWSVAIGSLALVLKQYLGSPHVLRHEPSAKVGRFGQKVRFLRGEGPCD